MQTEIRVRARVLPGKRVEFTAPELTEGDEVEISVVVPDREASAPLVDGAPQGVWDFIQSLVPVVRTPAEWAEVDREFYEERDSWDL